MRETVLQERRPGSPYEEMLVTAISGWLNLTFFGVIFIVIWVVATSFFAWPSWEDKRAWILPGCWGAVTLMVLCTLISMWFRDLGVRRRFGLLDVRLISQIVQGKRFTVRIEREVRKPIVIDRLDVSLMLIERTGGQIIADGGSSSAYLDERQVWSTTQPCLGKKTLPTHDLIKAEVEFLMPDEHPLRQTADRKHESEERDRFDAGVVVVYRSFFWQIRIKTCLSDGFVTHAEFLVSFASDA